MSILYIRLASRAAADSSSIRTDRPCPFALVTHGNTIERQGMASLSELSGAIAAAQRVVLLLAGSDVTVLRMQVPPLSQARLKAALPNLVEDRVLADPEDCIVVAGGISAGLRTLAVVQRAWFEKLASTISSFGARHATVLPAQLCLPQPGQTGQPDRVSAAIGTVNDGVIELTLRLSEQEGIGLAIAHEAAEPPAQAAIRTLCALVPEKPVALYVPQTMVRACQDVVNSTAALGKRISVSADNWNLWIAGASHAAPDLMGGLASATGAGLNWRRWRWPLALAAAILIVNVTALNISWWRMKSEDYALHSGMIRIYRSAYPKETVIIDPLAQMQRKIAVARQGSGMPAPDDFTVITAALGAVWNSAAAGQPAPAIAALEYHDHSLLVRLKPAGGVPTSQMKTALARYGLALDVAPAQAGAVVWQIRSKK